MAQKPRRIAWAISFLLTLTYGVSEVDAQVVFSKAFDGPTVAGGTPVLTFTITNAGAVTVTDLSFSDDLDAVVSGLVATGLPVSDVCGLGSVVSGTSFLTFSGGSLPPSGGACSFAVTLQVPVAAAAGSYPNSTSDLFAAGLPVTSPATANLAIEPPPSFSKAFAPATINSGGVSTLAFTIDNTASVLAATAIDFTDVLPAGLEVASPPNASTTCTGGTLTAVAGTGVISYTGGSVAAGAACIVQADITGVAVGIHVNTTGDLTSSSGNSGTSTDTLTVDPAAASTAIPTLSATALLLMVSLFATAGVLSLRRY
jgi:hypothetical protein